MSKLLFLFLACISIAGSLLATPADSTALQYFNKAGNLLMQAPDSARYYYEAAQPLFKAEKQWENYVDCFNGIANSYYVQDNFELLEQSILEAVNASERYLGKDSKVYSATLNNLGVVLRKKGHYDEALVYLKRSVDSDLQYHQDKLSIADSYQNINAAYRLKGDYDEAISYLLKALQFRKDSLGEMNYSVASTYLALGHNYRDKSDFDTGLSYYRKYLSMVQSGKIPAEAISNTEFVYCYQGMAQIYMEKQQADSSRYYLDQALQLQQTPKARRKIQTYEILGDLHLRSNKPKEALLAYQQAVQLAQKRYQRYTRHITKARTLRLAGNAFQQLEQADSALYYHQQAFGELAFDFSPSAGEQLPAPEQLISKVHALEVSGSKAEALQLKYKQSQSLPALKAAHEHYLYAAQLIDQLRQSYLSEGSKHTLAREALRVCEGGIQTALLLHRASTEAHYLESAFAFAERNKSMLLLEALQNSEAKMSGRLSDADLAKEERLSVDINFYEGKVVREKQRGEKANAEKIKTWQDQLFSLREEYKQLIQYFEQQYPQYYQLKYDTQIATPDALRKQFVGSNTALIEYFVGKEHSYIFCLTATELQVFPLENTVQLFGQQAELLTLISKPPFDGNFADHHINCGQLLSQLSQQLIAPVLQQLPASIRQLIIIPEDQLSYLPFELLLHAPVDASAPAYSSSNFPYLISKYAISSNYSATLLLKHSQPSDSKGLATFTGFGPSFGSDLIASSRDCSASEIYSLQCNQQEVETINKLFDGQVQLGEWASTASFKELAGQSRILHLATHACAGQKDQALNKIFFADGYLSNSELQNMQLNAELAVLSACNTGSGQLIKGEGVMSLSRSFILAGCPSTLMSLWTVDDCFTSELMLRFYAKLKDGYAKDEALRLAKMEHLAGADQVGRHPYYWAAFIQSGNPAAMQFRSAVFGWPRLLLLLAVILFGVWKLSKK